MNILGHYYLSFEIIISVSCFCEICFSFLLTASSVCDLIAGSHTFCYRAEQYTFPEVSEYTNQVSPFVKFPEEY